MMKMKMNNESNVIIKSIYLKKKYIKFTLTIQFIDN